MLGLVLALIIAFLSMFIPGLLLAFALLKKSELNTFEIVVIGFIFGLIAPATLTWIEGYLINYVHAFTFSLWLFELNALVLTIVGAILCWREGAFSDFSAYLSKKIPAKTGATASGLDDARHRLNHFTSGKQIVSKHIQEFNDLKSKHSSEVSAASKLTEEERSKITALHKETQEKLLEEQLKEERMLLQELEGTAKAQPSAPNFRKPAWWIWVILLVLMLATFYTRMQSIVTAPKFFEFDPYFDMIDAHYILTYGKQLLLDPAAWPVVAAGTNHRLQPLVPYLEAYWYSLVNALQYHHAAFSTSLMSYTGSIYPPIAAALLVFVIFMLLYHEYDERIGLIGAALTAMMPVLLTTFVAGEQLVEPIGILTLFFFFATYMLAIRNMKDKRLAILAGIAFASTFLGAHYYTVTAGVLIIYILAQGIIDVLRNEQLKDFYTMNIIVLATIIIFYALYAPYQATLQSNLSSILGIPIIIAAPVLSLLLVAVFDYHSKNACKEEAHNKRIKLQDEACGDAGHGRDHTCSAHVYKAGRPCEKLHRTQHKVHNTVEAAVHDSAGIYTNRAALPVWCARIRCHRCRILQSANHHLACVHTISNAHIHLHSIQEKQDGHTLYISSTPTHGRRVLRGQVPAPFRHRIHTPFLHSTWRDNVPRMLKLLQKREEQERGIDIIACPRYCIAFDRFLTVQFWGNCHHSARNGIRRASYAFDLLHPIREKPL